MDLQAYYKTVREAEATITQAHVVMVSLVTPEGGKAGVRTEAPRAIAARLIADLRARVATKEEAEQFHQANAQARARHDSEESARRIQVMVIPANQVPVQNSRVPESRPNEYNNRDARPKDRS